MYFKINTSFNYYPICFIGNFPNRCIHDPSRCTSGLSVMFWYKSMDDTYQVDILSSVAANLEEGPEPYDEGFFISKLAGPYLEFGVVYSGSVHKAYGTYPGSTTTWHHVAMIWDKSLSSNGNFNIKYY